MANEPGRVRRALVRVINDDNLDLYLLGTVALVFTVLGITGISDVKTTSAVVVALLALLAFSQIKSRRLLEQLRGRAGSGVNALFSREFPADLIQRRAQARDILLVGNSLTRTVQGLRSEMASIISAGTRIRVLVLDVTDEHLIEVADKRYTHTLGPDKLRTRISHTLEDLVALQKRTGGRLEIRVSSAIPPMGFNCLDTDTSRGLVCVQHFEYRPVAEAAPIFTLEPADGAWYQHFVAEAERLWEAGAEWPLSPEAAAARARRPAFSAEFGPELDAAVEETADLFVTGTARNVFVNTSFKRLQKKLLAGARVRFLLVDPDSSAVTSAANRYFAERDASNVRERVLHSLKLLAELKDSTGGDLSVRLTSHPVALSVIVTDAGLFAEYFPYRSPATPKFVLRPGDAAHDVFLAEVEALWREAKTTRS